MTRRVSVADDAAKFLELLLSECCTGLSEHEWQRCPRCLAIIELDSHQPLARSFLQAALAALRTTAEKG